jgi:hypothetical protein
LIVIRGVARRMQLLLRRAISPVLRRLTMRKNIITGLLLRGVALLGAALPAQAGVTRSIIAMPDVVAAMQDVHQAREAGEAQRRENRRADRRADRRRADAQQAVESGIVLVREGGSRRSRGRDGR